MTKTEEMLRKAIKNFPRWSDIRKRPHKAKGALYLRSILDEQAGVRKELNDFIKEHFLITYAGREDQLLEKAYTLQIGKISRLEDLKLVEPELLITENAKVFMDNQDIYALYQDDNLVISTEIGDKNPNIKYNFNGYDYVGVSEKINIWNIIDEFAMFLGLERFENENNRDLFKRCFAVCLNKTSSTEEGLKNTIINAMMNINPIEPEQIKIETPDEYNIHLNDSEGETIYEILAKLNHDIFRTKKWDVDTWEHEFKKLEFIPHQWDAPIEISQDGTGQKNDLKVSISDGSAQTTDLTVSAYKVDKDEVMKYIQKKSLSQEITLGLEKFKDELAPVDVQYKIEAAEVSKIDPEKIHLTAKKKLEGSAEYNIDQLVTDSGDATVIDSGDLPPGKYKLKFLPESKYCEMNIEKIDIIGKSGTESLMKENKQFKLQNGVLKEKDILMHITALKDVKMSEGFYNSENGFVMDGDAKVATLSVDVTDMKGKYIVADVDCDPEDITTNEGHVDLENGFSVTEQGTILSETAEESTTTISVQTSYIEFSLAAAKIASKQGSCSVTIKIDGKLDTDYSGIWNKPRTYKKELGAYSDVEITIQKLGMYPVEISGIKVKKYKLTTWTETGSLIKTIFGTQLPRVNGKNTYHVQLENFGAKIPYIKSIHVGPSLSGVSYETEPFTITDERVSIKTNCNVQLLKAEKNLFILEKDNYITRKTYANGTSKKIMLMVNMDDFSDITSSSKKINTTVYLDNVVRYVTLEPGESIASIKINGTILKTTFRERLNNLLDLAPDTTVYISSISNGFIVVNNKTGKEEIRTLEKKLFPKDTEIFTYEGVPNGAKGIFVIDEAKEIKIIGNKTTGMFEYSHLILTKKEKSIAYNSEKLFQKEVFGVQVVNTFSPAIEPNKLMFYKVYSPTNSEIMFEKVSSGKTIYEDWSLGLKEYGLRVKSFIDYSNQDIYNKIDTSISEKFKVSNTIELNNTYEIGGEEQELARYIITPPDDMVVRYEEEDVQNPTIIVTEDKFNKLYYSNITSIISIIVDGSIFVDESEYNLMSREGIIVWKNNKYIGKSVTVNYSYNKPVSISFKNVESLYKLTSYNVNSYKKLQGFPIKYEDMEDGEQRIINYPETPDKIVIRCSNPLFVGKTNGNTVTAIKTTSIDKITVEPGYFYDDGQEYYMYAHEHNETIDAKRDIEYVRVTRRENEFLLHQNASNLLKNSVFKTSGTKTVCHIDKKCKKKMESLNNMIAITACESLDLWDTYAMKTAIVKGKNGNAIEFTAEDGKSAYAILEITEAYVPEGIISMYGSEDLTIKLMKEVRMEEDLPFNKSVYCEEYKRFDKKDKLFTCKFSEEPTDHRFFIMIEGSGTIDDIIISKKEYAETDVHIKNLDAIGLEVIEKNEKNTILRFPLSPSGQRYEKTQQNSDGIITMGSTVDWGLTKIYDLKEEDDYKCKIFNVVKENEVYVSKDDNGKLTLPPIYIRNYGAAKNLYIKINDVLTDSMSNFDITAMGSDTLESPRIKVGYTHKENILQISNNKISPYIYLTIEMTKGKVIKSLEVYAEYAEKTEALHITTNKAGSFYSKIYDMGADGDYTFKRFDAEVTGKVNVFMRGLRLDKKSNVWTRWYNLQIDHDGFPEAPHFFEDYRLFQFRVDMTGEDTECKINSFDIEVV